ncbi:MAG: PDZ domain-containing protein, partial [bacterium]
GSRLVRKLGMSLREVSTEQARQWGFEVDHPLVQVKRLVRGSIAHRSGVRPSDIILSLNRDPVSSLSSFKQNLSQLHAAGTNSILLLVHRDGNRTFISVPLPNLE